jgi:hypothetical protein
MHNKGLGGAMERMQNLGKRLGFHEDAKILWLGYWEFGMPMGFWVFPLFLVFFHEGRLGGFLLRVCTLDLFL